METQQVDDFIAHFGVKGMQWGVRKQRGSKGGSSTPAPAKAAPSKTNVKGSIKSAQDKHGRIKKGEGPVQKKPETPTHHISDEELRQRINRIDMERKYIALTTPAAKKSKGAAAAKFAADILLDIGKQQ